MTEPVPGTPGGWTVATIREVVHPMPRYVILRLATEQPIRHVAGQHVLIRLRAADGYTAQRSYSIASAPGDDLIELAVERLDDGEVSGWLADVAAPGDQFDIRGPIGGWFAWPGETPAVGVGGGTGVVPMVAMLRQARTTGSGLLRLAVSARTPGELLYADEFRDFGATVAFTRGDPGRGARPVGRLTPAEIRALTRPGSTGYVCGSPAFAEAGSQLLLAAGIPATAIRIERFGPTS